MGNFTATIANWVDLSEKTLTNIIQQSVQDTLDIPAGQSMARGAPGPVQGAVPVDFGHLINTKASDLNGSGNFPLDTVSDVSLSIAGMEPGDILNAAWTAEYAAATNYGHGTYFGAHWLEAAAAKWVPNVEANTRKFAP